MGVNPLPAIVLPPRSRTVVEFSVRATVDAEYLAGYEFRVTDDGETLPGGAEDALVVLSPQPQIQLSAGQRVGVSSGTPGRYRGRPSISRSRHRVAPANRRDATAERQTSLRFALIPPYDGSARWHGECRSRMSTSRSMAPPTG